MLHVTSTHYRQSGNGIPAVIPASCAMEDRVNKPPLRPSNSTLRALAQCHAIARLKRTS